MVKRRRRSDWLLCTRGLSEEKIRDIISMYCGGIGEHLIATELKVPIEEVRR